MFGTFMGMQVGDMILSAVVLVIAVIFVMRMPKER